MFQAEGGEGMITLRPEVRIFAEAMELKLSENEHKPGWDWTSPEWLFGRLLDEVEELREAILSNQNTHVVTREAADVANFAMMIASRIAHQRHIGEVR
jgi:NTP pyrophosphatase (non-canonical NTP hydrolase)